MVFMDLQVPDIDGFDFLADIIVSCPDIPVFVMTAFGTPESRAHIEKIANCRYVEKPLDILTLEDLVFKDLKMDSPDGNTGKKKTDSDIQASLKYDEHMRIPDHTGIENGSEEMISILNDSSANMDIGTSGGSEPEIRQSENNKRAASRTGYSTAGMLSNALVKISGISAYGIFDNQDVLQTSQPEVGDITKIKPSIFKEISMDLSDLMPPEGLNYIVLKTKNYMRYVLFEFRNVSVVMFVNPEFHLHEFMTKLKQVEPVSDNYITGKDF